MAEQEIVPAVTLAERKLLEASLQLLPCVMYDLHGRPFVLSQHSNKLEVLLNMARKVQHERSQRDNVGRGAGGLRA